MEVGGDRGAGAGDPAAVRDHADAPRAPALEPALVPCGVLARGAPGDFQLCCLLIFNKAIGSSVKILCCTLY